MGLPVQNVDQKYTYSDYLTWPEEERWEIIDGDAYNMSPAPLRIHQEILTILTSRFYNFFEGKTCKVYVSPFDVRLPKGDEADEEIDTVVQPDLSVICDPAKLDRWGCKGPPDLVVEILSPGSAGRDMKDKLKLYEKHGVKEYWLVYPYEQVVELFVAGNDTTYRLPDRFKNDETVESSLFPGLEIDLAKVFAGIDPGEA
ncbi:MAG: Uma2 family endonuclease [Spirochaetales bacterium]|nr:Uma2 family endonuclease [Spirochaetales bacterium]